MAGLPNGTDELDRILDPASDSEEKEKTNAPGNHADDSDGELDAAISSQGRKIVKRLVQISRGALGTKTKVLAAERYQRKEKKKDIDKPYKGWSIVLRTIVSFEGVIKTTRLEVQSRALCDVIKDLARPHWRQVNLAVKPIIFEKPFRTLFFLKGPLEDHLADSSLTPKIREEITTLLDFITNDRDGLMNLVKTYNDEVGGGQISFGMAWALFPPETIVYFEDGEKEECAMVESVHYGDNGGPLYLKLVQFRHEGGGTHGTVHVFRTIMPFPHLAKITLKDLGVIPMESLPKEQQESITDRLYRRGRKYLEVQEADVSHRSYKGPFWSWEAGSLMQIGNSEDENHVQISGRVVVDTESLKRRKLRTRPEIKFESLAEHFKDRKESKKKDDEFREHYRSLYGRRSSISSSNSSSDADSIDEKEVLDTGGQIAPLGDMAVASFRADRAGPYYPTWEEHLLCPATVCCFFLGEQQWGEVLVQYLAPISWNDTAFDKLQMRAFDKETIKSLVKGFDPHRVIDFDDIIQYKGKGLIFLLYGEPGLGKTLTAESIAEHARRPLYHVTTGQLSSDVTKLESELKTIFELGSRWNAVVLLDEADVLMAQRTDTDLARNAVVAVFLRLIEYYRGLLFLTTNRRKGIDKAFDNRIHVKINYPQLDEGARTAIWDNLLSKSNLADDAQLSSKVYATLGRLRLNGRDIRNIIRVAHSLKQGQAQTSKGKEKSLMVQSTLRILMAAVRINVSDDEDSRVSEVDAVESDLALLMSPTAGPGQTGSSKGVSRHDDIADAEDARAGATSLEDAIYEDRSGEHTQAMNSLVTVAAADPDDAHEEVMPTATGYAGDVNDHTGVDGAVDDTNTEQMK